MIETNVLRTNPDDDDPDSWTADERTIEEALDEAAAKGKKK